jgi:predicted TIM-barrel enzyme
MKLNLNFVIFNSRRYLIFSAHAITSDVNLQETAKAAEFFLCDGVIVTGATTGDPVDTRHLHGKLHHSCRHL